VSMLHRARCASTAYRKEGLRGIMHLLLSRYGLPVTGSAECLWREGDRGEIAFWDEWLRTKGSRWPASYPERLDPDLLLQPTVASMLPAQSKVDILDVGAGPLTSLGKKLPGREIEITAIDARADEWDRLLEKYGVQPIVRSQKLLAEELTGRFAVDTFDLVYARNSIDHCDDPERAVVQMIEVVKPRCYVVLEHSQNEGEHSGWRGPHQHNLSMSSDGAFTIASKRLLVDMTAKYADLCCIECRLTCGPRAWLITKIRKR